MGSIFPSPSMQNIRPLVAELLGTFLLALLVHVSLKAGFPLATPVVAGLTLGLVVYMLGSISGAHVNPAVTIGLFSIGKIQMMDAVSYIVAQFIGGALALVVGNALLGTSPSLVVGDSAMIVMAEALGAAILVLGVSSVVHGKAPHDAAGLTIGGALLLGVLAASTQSNGVLNPAVALGIGSVSLSYIAGPVIGGVLAAWGYRWLVKA